jgi:hypothetical protein
MGTRLKSKFLIGLSIVLSLFRYASAADLQPLTIRDFTCGLVNTFDPATIGDGCAQSLQNVDVWTGRVQKSRGDVLQNATNLTGNLPVRFLHEFPDQNGNFWMLAASSNTIWKSNNAGATFTALTSTHGITSVSEFSGVNAFGKARLTDGTTNWIIFDGSAITVSTASPKGKLAAFYYGRVFTADVAGSRSTLYMSRVNDPEDWTNDGVSDGDSRTEFVRQNDGYPIRALALFKGSLLIFKDYSIDALAMNSDGLTYTVSPVSNTKGTQHPRSVQQTENTIIFLADDGFYEYDGVKISLLSNDISATIDSIVQLNTNSRSFTETTQTDFNNGTPTSMSASISPNSVVLSTNQFIDTEKSQFEAGSVGTGLSTTYSSGSVVMTSDGLVDDFSDGDTTTNPAWVVLGATPTVVSGQVKFTSSTTSGIYTSLAQATGSWRWSYSHDSDDTSAAGIVAITTYAPTAAIAYAGTGAVFSGYKVEMFPYATALHNFHVSSDVITSLSGTGLSGLNTYILNVTSYNATLYFNDVSLGSVSRSSFSGVSYFYMGTSGSVSTTFPAIFDEVYISSSIFSGVTSSTLTSRALSIGRNETIVGQFTATDTLNSGTITYGVYSDSNTSINVNSASTFISSASVTNGASFSLVYSSYVFYSANFRRTQTNYTPTLRDAQIDVRASTGTFLGQAIALGSSASSFGPFRADETLNSGTLVYTVYIDTDTSLTPSASSTFVSSQIVTNNGTPSLAVNSYARIGVAATASSYAANPSFDGYTVQWYEGSGNFPVASLYFDQDYIIAVATQSTTANDTMLVLDRNRHWVVYTGMNAYSMVRYSQRPYFGDASSGKVYRFQADGIYTYNGSPIYSQWTSKEFDFGYTLEDKTMQRYYITAQRTVNSDILFEYGVNRGTMTSTTLDLDLYSGFFRKSIVPTSITFQRGISHRFRFSDSDTDDPFDILSIALFPRLETAP